MGHKGDIEATYTVNKGITQDTIERMREAYKKSEHLLSTEKQEGVSQENLKDVLKEQMLLAVGYSQEETDKLNFDEVSNEEFQAMLKQKLLGVMANNGSRQKVIQVGEVEQYIQQGWEYVASLSNEKAILKLPS